MHIFLAQIIISSLLVVAILLQSKGGGLSGNSGGGNYHSRRGFEIILFRATIVLAVLFAFTSLIALT